MQDLELVKVEGWDPQVEEIAQAWKNHNAIDNADNIDHQDGDDEERMDWYRLGIYHRHHEGEVTKVCLTHIGAELCVVDSYGNFNAFHFDGSSVFGKDFIAPEVTKEPKFAKLSWEDLHFQTSGYPDSALDVFTPAVLRNGKLALIMNTYDEPYGIEVYDLEFGRLQNVHSATGMLVDGIPSDLDIMEVFIRVDNERLM